MNCKDCKLLQNLNAQNKQLEKENDTLLKIMNATFSLTALWAKKEGLIKSGLDAKEDIDKELADGKEKIRALFNDIIKTGEPAFVDGFFRALDLPENFQHFI